MSATTAVFLVDEDVTARTGPFAGLTGVVDEIDATDPDQPFRVQFDLPGDPVAWFAGRDLEHAGGAA